MKKKFLTKKSEIEKKPYEMTREEYIKLSKEKWSKITNFVKYSDLPPEIKKVAQEKYIKDTGDIEGANPKNKSFVLTQFIFDKETGKIFGYDYPSHKEEIEWALKEGKSIPEEVLKDYPDLVKNKN